jgi:hypothetical protein
MYTGGRTITSTLAVIQLDSDGVLPISVNELPRGGKRFVAFIEEKEKND